MNNCTFLREVTHGIAAYGATNSVVLVSQVQAGPLPYKSPNDRVIHGIINLIVFERPFTKKVHIDPKHKNIPAS